MKRYDIEQWRCSIIHWLLERLTIDSVLVAEESAHTKEMVGTTDWYFQSEVKLYADTPTAPAAAPNVVGHIDVWVDDHCVQLTGCLSRKGWSDTPENESLFEANWVISGELQKALDGLADWVAHQLPLPARPRFYKHSYAYPWQAESFPAVVRR